MFDSFEAHKRVADDIANAYSEGYEDGKASVNQWIPCEERLPREDELILVNVIRPDRVYPIILCMGKNAYAMAEHGDINAWMPLPEPYGEEN